MGDDRIQGQVERITYSSEEDGYSVVKVRVAGRRDLVTVVGNFVSVTPGEVLRLEGSWSSHPKFGEQFKAERYETAVPATVEGIRRYLGSGLVKGIGPKTAARIVDRFGERTLDVIESESERLLEVEGIGDHRIGLIRKAWEDQKEIREIMLFLRSYGVSAVWAARIFKQYGNDAISVVKGNPYRLAMDVSGIGFITADGIAQKLGFSSDSPLRAEAGILFVLLQSTEEGHVCIPRSGLMERCAELLQMPSPVLAEALDRLLADGRLVSESVPESAVPVFKDDRAVYLRGYHLAETQTAARLVHLQAFRPLQRKIDPDAAMEWLRKKMPFTLAPLQEEAVRAAVSEKVLVVTGGPGTGKTTLVQAILAIYKHLGASICLAAPTGRAAKRLNETTRHPAGTLHRLLEFSPQSGGFQRNEQRPLAADLVIVDEASMLDALLMHYLVKAVPTHATLVLVGDIDQLPSVGPGNVLRDVIESGRFSVTRLTEIFRQAKQSRIVTNAHLVKEGKFPKFGDETEELQDFYFIEKEDPEEAARLILKLCAERIPARFGLDPIEDIQVLSPMHRGSAGAQRLNTLLQETLNPTGSFVERAGQIFRVGDKVMQIRNNYDKDVFNGDLGRIRSIDAENREIRVEVDGRGIAYDFKELDELVLAYAVSIHKSQGSEYPAVVFPLLSQHFVMLQRNLLYTAITRARKLAVVVGSKKALAVAIRNNKVAMRFTLLRERLTAQ